VAVLDEHADRRGVRVGVPRGEALRELAGVSGVTRAVNRYDAFGLIWLQNICFE
jgi:hypothetical protein